MRTNKNCPKYRADPDTQLETADSEKASGKSNTLDPSSQSQPKSLKKKLISKSATKIAVVEASENEKSNSKAKVLPLKFKCGSTDKLSDKVVSAHMQSSDQPVTSDVETANKSVAKVNKIKISNKLKPEEMQAESHNPSIVIRPLADADRVQAESPRPSIVIRPPTNIYREQESHKPAIVIRPRTSTDREQAESNRPSIVIRPPMEKDRELPQKKIIIKRPKEIIDLDQVSPDGATHLEYRKTKKIIDLSSFEKCGKQERSQLIYESSEKKGKEERRWWEEEEKRNAARLREERARRLYEEEMRVQEERERFAEIKRYEESIRREREEEERQKAKKKKKKKPEIAEDYLEDYRTRRNDRRMPERDRSAKRRHVSELGKYVAESGPPTKRRRGGEVGLSNILECIVETLRENTDVSFLFLKPVSKKEAPDYLDIVKHPMDLSTIRDKVRRMEYKDREEFRHDVCQIAINAHIYNDGRNPGIPPLADQLLELCDYLLHENRRNLSEAEAGIGSRNI
ncbi:transcription initiation factor TFIID subunit 1-like [Pistacia vera]|uniref:transcription initiation factor TFIID subunit 1-like n=1 Tax=Pistacia vera TaxID=55513 RepID=UPI00126305BD|nr:transcription initiation factor TFIID subunit 1-like [Pistacia vera]